MWLLCGYLVWEYLGGRTCVVLWACVPCVRVKFGGFVIRIGEGQQQTFLNLFLFFKACQPWAKAPNVPCSVCPLGRRQQQPQAAPVVHPSLSACLKPHYMQEDR